jgi:hypothetical protein
MKLAVLFVLFAVPAFAQEKPLCVDASRDGQYNARPLSQHDVLARNSFGSDHRAARLGTTCIHIYRDSLVSLRSLTQCIALGDEVGISTIDGRSERCRVTSVAPIAESYAEAKYR